MGFEGTVFRGVLRYEKPQEMLSVLRIRGQSLSAGELYAIPDDTVVWVPNDSHVTCILMDSPIKGDRTSSSSPRTSDLV